jgi:hypothetical protein
MPMTKIASMFRIRIKTAVCSRAANAAVALAKKLKFRALATDVHVRPSVA